MFNSNFSFGGFIPMVIFLIIFPAILAITSIIFAVSAKRSGYKSYILNIAIILSAISLLGDIIWAYFWIGFKG